MCFATRCDCATWRGAGGFVRSIADTTWLPFAEDDASANPSEVDARSRSFLRSSLIAVFLPLHAATISPAALIKTNLVFVRTRSSFQLLIEMPDRTVVRTGQRCCRHTVQRVRQFVFPLETCFEPSVCPRRVTPNSHRVDRVFPAFRGVLYGMRPLLIAAAAATVVVTACNSSGDATPTAAERAAIADSLKHLVINTYDLSKPDVVNRMMSLYPREGPVISANSGGATTTRDSLRSQIETFWKYVGSNMRNPKWEWTSMHIDVLSRNAAVMTATYRIPHLTPSNMPHVIGGAWTAVFVNRGGRWAIIQEHLSDAPPAPMTMPMS